MANISITSLFDDMKPYIIDLFNTINQATGGDSGGMSVHDLNGSFHSGTLDIVKVPDAVNRNGSTMLGNLDAASGVTFDGVDISVFNTDFLTHIGLSAVAAHGTVGAHNHQTTDNGGTLDHGLALTGRSDDDHTQYMHNSVARTVLARHTFNPALANSPFILGANAQGQTVVGFRADQLNKSVTGTSGLTGGGLLTANQSLSVDLAYAFNWTNQHTFTLASALPPFILNANAQGQTVVGLKADQLNKSVTGTNGVTGGGALTADQSLSLDQSYSPTWTGAHTFTQTMTTASIKPSTSYSFDLGLIDKMYRKAWIAELQALVFAENTIQVINGEFLISKDGGSLAADVLAADTTMNFGKTMTPNDFVVFQDVGKYEKIQVGTLVSGTTYNVTRNTDGSGANDWPSGSAFAVLGFTGNGYISLSATVTPRQSFWLHGADYDDVTELGRFGDLNGNWGYATTKYGLAWGRYQVAYPNLVFDEDGTFAIRRYNTDILRFDATANYLSNPLLLGTDGGIYQGTGTFASPTRGLKFYNSGGYGVLEGYNSGAVQAAFNSSGEITWLAGLGKLNADGAQIQTDTSFSFNRGYRFVDASNNLHSGLFSYQTPSATTTHVELYATSTINTAESALYAESNSGAVAGFMRVRATALGSTATISTGTTEVSSGTVTVAATTSLALGTAGATAATIAGTSAAINPTTLNLGTATTTAINLGRSAATLIDASPTAFTNQPTTIPTFSGDGLYFLLNTSNRGFDGLWERNSGTSNQLSIPHVTAFPSSPTTNLTVYRTDYRSLWNYDGSTWRQVSQGAFSGSFPSSPQDDMRVWRSDRNLEYFYNSATTQWLTTTIFTASEVGDVRVLAPYPNTLTVATAVNTFHVDNDTYSIRVVDSYITSMTTGTNNGTNYWNYSIGYANNNGGGGVTLVSGNTSAAAANSTTRIAISDVTITSNATAGRVAFTLNTTGTPTSYTIRGIIKYRFVG